MLCRFGANAHKALAKWSKGAGAKRATEHYYEYYSYSYYYYYYYTDPDFLRDVYTHSP